tara:strand:- start:321 stop:1610 length:1290 start_codon:yes stop_codon:yes gene_type:complete
MKNYKITIVGLGYVGLPLAVEFAKKFKTVGFDINDGRINEIRSAKDKTMEVSNETLKNVLSENNEIDKYSNGLYVTSSIDEIRDSNIYIITVPTPTDKNKRPVLKPLLNASKSVGSVLKTGDIVVYESTVYPGVTEDICVPELEKSSGLKFNIDFFVGYSPERINPGDKERTISKILKITSGSTPRIAEEIDNLYKKIITAGTFLVSSIKVAEAAKVIENSQRDINIAFVNELSKIFNLLEIDTNEVLEAAGTKWNFLPFKPGLVGGHCIGIDPYYIAQRAQELGYYPEIILAGRRLNDSMGEYIVAQIIKLMVKNNIQIANSEILILGITFKENCPDIRNTRVIDIINTFEEYKANLTVYDPWANPETVKKEFGIKSHTTIPNKKFDVVILAVAHDKFKNLKFKLIRKNKSIIYDIKGFLNEKDIYRL